ncbi:Hypothetical protein I595_1166 [Croceitalea dokdonensis DOKDO 023]|uniref:Uncharacterized protein n=1 Tax=Croceitalea dokdonensis DOKDO 023 TaxID=1300341 RepID=A0A0P7AVT5_9FLAO|nr:Hypothetical protein I595_1166 [Croceitalea dokdonensis DOKDO 023]
MIQYGFGLIISNMDTVNQVGWKHGIKPTHFKLNSKRTTFGFGLSDYGCSIEKVLVKSKR